MACLEQNVAPKSVEIARTFIAIERGRAAKARGPYPPPARLIACADDRLWLTCGGSIVARALLVADFIDSIDP